MVDSEGNYLYKTKGDNNMVADPVAVQYANVTGKVLMKIPQLGRVQFFIASKAGWMLVVVVPALYVIIKDILRILKVIGPNNKITSKNNKKKKNILFMPIKRKPLYLPLHGYKDEYGNKEKFTLASLNPFTFEKEPAQAKPLTNNLEDIYKDLQNIANEENKK